MKSEPETIEKLAAISNVEMSSQKQQEIWENIEKEIEHMHPVRTKHRSSVWGTSAATVAAVALVAGGFYAYSNHGTSTSHNLPGNTAASNNANPTSNPTGFPSLDAIQSISVSSDTAAQTIWGTQDPKSVEKQILAWLKSSTPFTGTIPSSQEQGVTNAYSGPSKLHMETTGHQRIVIYPVFYRAKAPGGLFQNKYVQNVVAYDDGTHVRYLTCPELYTWLKNDQWKTEFGPPSTPQTSSPYTDTQLANLTPKQLGAYRENHGSPLSFAGKDVRRVAPNKSSVFFGASSVQTSDGSTHKAQDFEIVDMWTGTIQSTSFRFQIDKAKSGKGFVVDVWAGNQGFAMALAKQPWITNFTGSYVVFGTPNPAQGNPMYAINLKTASIVRNSSMNKEYVWELSGVGMGGYPSGITGLNKQYSTFPNGQGY